MYIKDEYKGIISKVNLLMEEYKNTGNETILSIVK